MLADRLYRGVPIIESWTTQSIESVESVITRGGKRYTYRDLDSQRWRWTFPTLPDFLGGDGHARDLWVHQFDVLDEPHLMSVPQPFGADVPSVGTVELASAVATRDRTIRLRSAGLNAPLVKGAFFRIVGDLKIYLLLSNGNPGSGRDFRIFPHIRRARPASTDLDFTPSATVSYDPDAIREIAYSRGSLESVVARVTEALS